MSCVKYMGRALLYHLIILHLSLLDYVGNYCRLWHSARNASLVLFQDESVQNKIYLVYNDNFVNISNDRSENTR